MSRWWNKFRKGTLQVALLPDRLEFVAIGGPDGIEDHGSVPVIGRTGVAWQAALAAGEQFLAQPHWQGWRVRILLSDAWVAYRVLPWDPSVVGRKQWESYADAYFQDTPAGSDEWRVVMEPVWPETNTLACRLPVALIEGVREACQKNRLTLASVQPWFVGSLNRYRPPTPSGDFWWASADGFRLVCGLWRAKKAEDGARGWQLVRNQAADEQVDPVTAIVREEMLAGCTGEPPPILVCCRDSGVVAASNRMVLAGTDTRSELRMVLAA